MTTKRFCDRCGEEIVYHYVDMYMKSLPNSSSAIDIHRDLCYDCGKIVRKAIGFALGKIKNAH